VLNHAENTMAGNPKTLDFSRYSEFLAATGSDNRRSCRHSLSALTFGSSGGVPEQLNPLLPSPVVSERTTVALFTTTVRSPSVRKPIGLAT
jgi:hypothetical protein